MAESANRAARDFRETRERCFICPNDILEREFRTFIVSGWCACYIQSRHGARQGFLQYEQAKRPVDAIAPDSFILYDTESSQSIAQWKVSENRSFKERGETKPHAGRCELQIFIRRRQQVGGIDAEGDER